MLAQDGRILLRHLPSGLLERRIVRGRVSARTTAAAVQPTGLHARREGGGLEEGVGGDEEGAVGGENWAGQDDLASGDVAHHFADADGRSGILWTTSLYGRPTQTDTVVLERPSRASNPG